MRRVLTMAVVVVAVGLLLVGLATLFMVVVMNVTAWLHLQHVLGIDTQQSKNYDLASGEGPMLVAALGFSSVGVGIWRHINCEHPGCLRPGHRHPDHGRPVCRKHYHADVAPGPQ